MKRQLIYDYDMKTSWNGNIFPVTGHLCGKFTGEFPTQRPVTHSFDVLFDLRLNERLSKQSRGWWFETPTRLSWRHHNEIREPFYWDTKIYLDLLPPSPCHPQPGNWIYRVNAYLSSQNTLNVTKFASNMCMYSKLRRFPILHNAWSLAIKYWLRLCTGTGNTLFNIPYRLAMAENHMWVQSIQYLLSSNCLGDIRNILIMRMHNFIIFSDCV